MVDGPAAVEDREHTEANRALVRAYTDEVLVQRRLDRLAEFVCRDHFTQHSPVLSDGIGSLRSALAETAEDGTPAIAYACIHLVLAEGSFVLTVCEGSLGGIHTAFYDLYRVDAGCIVEHWDTRESVPPASEWKNDNGKF
jgi:predicted SnoaL-like aldol condensation-catalyzing enzyme